MRRFPNASHTLDIIACSILLLDINPEILLRECQLLSVESKLVMRACELTEGMSNEDHEHMKEGPSNSRGSSSDAYNLH